MGRPRGRSFPWLAALALGLSILGCNTFAGIEEGILALCADGTRIDETGCKASPDGGGGGDGGSGDCRSCPTKCTAPWQYEYAATGSCYLQDGTDRDWKTARQRCVDLGGDLAAIGSAEELSYLGTVVPVDLWIGGTDADVEGTFQWSNGEAWEFARWKEGSPDDQGGKRDCVMLSVTLGSLPSFDDRQCGEKRGFLCEKSATP